MTGIDTNILVCYLVQDDPQQSKVATEFLEKLLTTVELSFEYRDEAWKALQLCRSEGLDFADALIGIIHQTHGCDRMLTFDKNAAKIPFFELAH